MDNLIYWLWLTLKKMPAHKILKLIDTFGSARDAFGAGEKEYVALDFLSEKDLDLLLDKNLLGAKREWRRCARLGIMLLTFFDKEYPILLKEIPNPPALLYVLGDITVLQNRPAIAFVGSRSCSAYGMTTTLQMAQALAAAGFVIVSGMAVGIDAAAHRGALMARGKTVAVLGCGLDVPYPRDNQELKEEIIKSGGAVISELPLKTPPLGTNFSVRNRIISGLALGVVVAEAGLRSGALLTAGHAAEQGRDVFAIPGNINSPTAGGANRLIQDGAILLDKPDIVIEEYMARYPELFSNMGKEEDTPDKEKAGGVIPAGGGAKEKIPLRGRILKAAEGGAPPQDKGNFDLILKHIKNEPVSVDELCQKTRMPAGEVNAALLVLSVQGKIKELPGRLYIKAE